MPEVVAKDSVEVLENPDGWLTVIDEETGVTSQGATLPEALRNLAEALEGYYEALKKDTGRAQVPDAPWFE